VDSEGRDIFVIDAHRDGNTATGAQAEDVEKVNPDLVARDDKGEIYSVRYDARERDVAQRVSQRAQDRAGTKVYCHTAAKADRSAYRDSAESERTA
jgi:hypothetical protein